jgi:hypothetical protein
MKNFQVRLTDELFAAAKEMADQRGTSLADVIRQSLEDAAIASIYAAQGRQLFWMDLKSGTRTEVVVPALTLRMLRKTR